MKIRGEYKLNHIGLRQWQKFAREARIEPDRLIERLIAMAAQLPDEANAIFEQVRKNGLDATIIEHLVTQLIERAGNCHRLLSTR